MEQSQILTKNSSLNTIRRNIKYNDTIGYTSDGKTVLCNGLYCYSYNVIVVHPTCYEDKFDHIAISYDEFINQNFIIPPEIPEVGGRFIPPEGEEFIIGNYLDTIDKNTLFKDIFKTGAIFYSYDKTSRIKILGGVDLNGVYCQNLDYPRQVRVYHRNNIYSGDFDNYKPMREHKKVKFTAI